MIERLRVRRAMGVSAGMLVGMVGLAGSLARADVVPGVTVAPSGQQWVAHSIIDGSGVNGDKHSTSPGDMWLSANGSVIADQSLRFDLGEVYGLGSIKLWNYNEPTLGDTDRGVNAFTVWASDTGVPGTFVQVGGSRTLAEAPGDAATDYAEAFNLAGAHGRFVQVDIDTNHGDATLVGLSEVGFDGTATGFGLDVTPVSVAASSQLNTTRGPNELFGPGLTAYDEHQASWADNAMWQSSAADWSDNQATLDFDLGEKKDLSAVRIWNFNEYPPDNTSVGVQTMEILVKSELLDSFTSVCTIHPSQASGLADIDFSEIFALDANDVQYVQFRITENYGAGTVGLSEVQFMGAVPEPATLAVLSLGGLALLGRRRNA